MRFRMTIMPREDGAAAGGLGGLTNAASGLSGNKGSVGGLTGGFGGGRTSGFAAGNTTPKIGGLSDLGGLASSLMGGKEGIIISPDELVSVDLSLFNSALSSTSSSETNLVINISGKLLSHVEEAGLGMPLSMGSLLSSFASNGMNDLTKGLNKGIQVLGNSFAGGLSNTLTGMMGKLGGNSFGLGNLYQNNMKNTKELAKWAISYGEKSDYRDVVLEMIINESVKKTYILPDLYAADYNESSNIGSGDGHFTMVLKQKRYSERKIEIE